MTPEPWWVSLGKVVVPVIVAILAAWLALLANGHLDKGRARREFVTKMSDGLRADVRDAVVAAADYWSLQPSNLSVLEARIKMLEQEIRAGSIILDDGDKDQKAVEFRAALQGFFVVLTGSDFESEKVSPNRAHIVTITGRGVALRKATAELRAHQLK